MHNIAIYPGSFDPITLGHLNIIERTLTFVDKLIVVVGINVTKKYFFDIEKRMLLIKESLNSMLPKELQQKVWCTFTDLLLVDFAKRHDAHLIIRGIRAYSDFDYEFNLAGINQKLDSSIQTIFLMANEKYQFVNSSAVKELQHFNHDLTDFVAPIVATYLEKHSNRKES